MSPKTQPTLLVRTTVPEDGPVCGQICYDAFSTISATHAFPCDFPGPDATVGALSMMFSTPGFYCVVAEHDGRIVGSNCLDERSIVSGVGPVTIDPGAQNLGIGRRLMPAVMDRASEQGAAGIRLVQAAFHNRSLSLNGFGLGADHGLHGEWFVATVDKPGSVRIADDSLGDYENAFSGLSVSRT